MKRAVRALALFAVAAAVACLAACVKPVKLKGVVMTMRHPAPDFTLTDQHGSSYRLSSDRGKVVVLTFIYTHCADICPFVALKVKEAIGLLGPDAKSADFVAVTTDPERDTVPVVEKYSQAIGLDPVWRFVTGTPQQLVQVWGDYGIGVAIHKDEAASTDTSASGTSDSGQSPVQGLSTDDLTLAGKIVDAFGGGYEVSHTAPYWIVDRQGNLKVIMDASVLPQDIVDNVKALAGLR